MIDFNSLDNRVGLLLLTVLHVPGQPINVPSGIRGIMRTDLRERERERERKKKERERVKNMIPYCFFFLCTSRMRAKEARKKVINTI